MLPSSYLSHYSNLRQQFQALLLQSDPRTLKTGSAALQKYFQSNVASLDLEEIDPSLEHRVRSLHVELDKQLRLLNTDTTFLQAAKQPETVQQRLGQVRDRLTTMIGYCNILLGETPSHQ